MSLPRPSRAQRRALESDNRRYGDLLQGVPKSEWPIAVVSKTGQKPKLVFRSRDFLVQVYDESNGIMRLSCSRTVHDGERFADGITWDQLQALKNQAGYELWWAVEVFPPLGHVVNVANMRHLWVLPEAPAFAWRRK